MHEQSLLEFAESVYIGRAFLLFLLAEFRLFELHRLGGRGSLMSAINDRLLITAGHNLTMSKHLFNTCL